MADRTGISYLDATWNPTTGCSAVSPGCANCWARRMAERMWPTQYGPDAVHAGRDQFTGFEERRPRQFDDVQCHDDRLSIPLRWRKPRRIGVSFMGDLFHDAVPDAFIDRIFAATMLCPQHQFLLLTKRPGRMRAYLTAMDRTRGIDDALMALAFKGTDCSGVKCLTQPHLPGGTEGWPLPNVWLGVSVEDQATADERIPLLLQTPAAKRWVSAEPLLGPVDLRRYLGDAAAQWDGSFESSSRRMAGPRLDWVVVGGES